MPSESSKGLTRERDGTYSAAGVWLGKQVAPGIFLEPTEEGRHQVRGLTKNHEPMRLGEVLGGNRRYSVFGNNGRLIAIERSLSSAVAHLQPSEAEATRGTGPHERTPATSQVRVQAARRREHVCA